MKTLYRARRINAEEAVRSLSREIGNIICPAFSIINLEALNLALFPFIDKTEYRISGMTE